MRAEESTIQKKKKKRPISSLMEENHDSEPIHIQLQCNTHLANEKEVADVSDSANGVVTYTCTLFQKGGGAQNSREYFALVHEENQYRIEVTNNDALDDYSVSVLVNGSPLGRVITKDTLELDAFYDQFKFDANATTIVIYTSRVDTIKKSRMDGRQDAHCNIIKVCHTCDLLFLFSSVYMCLF